MSFSLEEIQKISKIAKQTQLENQRKKEAQEAAEAIANKLRLERELQNQIRQDRTHIEAAIRGAAAKCLNEYTYQFGRSVKHDSERVKVLVEIFKDFKPVVKTVYEGVGVCYEADSWDEYTVIAITFHF